ncbi:MAG TPA: nucleotide exchange factor GrpE [Blastocatellia bacterium]
MSSNMGNKEASQAAAEAAQEHEIRVNDKRRFTAEGEPIAEIEEPASAEAPSVEVESLQAKLKESEEKRAEAERKVSEFADRFRKAQEQLKAETDEIRARINRTSEQKLEAARGDLVAGLLDTLDNLKRAVAAAEKSEKRGTDFNALLDGVRATANLFEARMQALGLTAIVSEGEDFNPELHEAVEIVPVDPEQDNKVIAEYQTGYKFGDRLLRPARVRVGRAS